MQLSPVTVAGVIALGVGLLTVSVGYLGTNPAPASALALLLAAIIGLALSAQRIRAWRQRRHALVSKPDSA